MRLQATECADPVSLAFRTFARVSRSEDARQSAAAQYGHMVPSSVELSLDLPALEAGIVPEKELPMTRFNVPEMSCGHCTAAIEKAIKEIDPAATVACSLDDRTVSISSALPAQALQSAIQDAGYTSEAA